jgi:hypothetical protein
MKTRALMLSLFLTTTVALRANPVAESHGAIEVLLLPHLAELVVIYAVLWRAELRMDWFLLLGGLMNVVTFFGLMLGLSLFGRTGHGRIPFSAGAIFIGEMVVVAVEALAWYRLAECNFMRRSLTPLPTLRRCFVASFLGNLTSFLVGHILW